MKKLQEEGMEMLTLESFEQASEIVNIDLFLQLFLCMYCTFQKYIKAENHGADQNSLNCAPPV